MKSSTGGFSRVRPDSGNGSKMKKTETNLSNGILMLPSFPIILITIGRNIMTAGAFHFYSFEPPSVMVGIIPDRYTYELINSYNEFGVNIPRADQIELVRICGSVSGREGKDKYKIAGVTPLAGSVIKSYLVDECPLNLECEVVHKVEFQGTHQWYVGKVKAVHIDEEYDRDQALMFWGREYRKVGEFLEYAW
jgi:flavin reductase (DIM6/NTAB) family NADH-FMN oxidoreductase RutF